MLPFRWNMMEPPKELDAGDAHCLKLSRHETLRDGACLFGAAVQVIAAWRTSLSTRRTVGSLQVDPTHCGFEMSWALCPRTSASLMYPLSYIMILSYCEV